MAAVCSMKIQVMSFSRVAPQWDGLLRIAVLCITRLPLAQNHGYPGSRDPRSATCAMWQAMKTVACRRRPVRTPPSRPPVARGRPVPSGTITRGGPDPALSK